MKKKYKKKAKEEKKAKKRLEAEEAKAAKKKRKSSVGPDMTTAQEEALKWMAPMTKEEWEKQQSVIRKVYDPDMGRHRLVKGNGAGGAGRDCVPVKTQRDQ